MSKRPPARSPDTRRIARRGHSSSALTRTTAGEKSFLGRTGDSDADARRRDFIRPQRADNAIAWSPRKTLAKTDASGDRRSFSLNDTRFDEAVRGLVHLLMSSPEYQLC